MPFRFKSPYLLLSIRRQLMLLSLLFLSGMLLFSFLAHSTLMATKVNGPYYDSIIQNKDLIADVLPPPAYIIEANLRAHQMVDTTDLEELSELMKSFRGLEENYVKRHSYWVTELPEGPLKDMMIVQSFESARQFFEIARRDLFPLLLNGEHAAANDLVRGVLRDCYQRHRDCVDKVVEMSTVQIAEGEQETRQFVANRTTLLISFGLALALSLTLSSETVGQRITRRLDETVHILDAVARGDLSQSLPTHGCDEIDQMGSALNQAIATSRQNLMAARAAEEQVRQFNVELEGRVSRRTFALQESEQCLQAILHTAIDAIIIIDNAGLIESVNPAAEQMFGYAHAELIDQNVKMLIPSPHREANDGYLGKLVTTGTTPFAGLRQEVVGQRKDGTIFPADLTVSSTELPGRHQFTGIVRDITLRKNSENELARAKETAEAANQAKSSFLAAMSHDLRTPLNGILGMNDLLRATELTSRQRQFIDACHMSGTLLLQLINDVLDLSKIESGKLELDLHECSVETLVYDVVEALGPGATQKGLALNAHVDLSICVTALCDGHRLRQILVNLIGNAIKFTATGVVTVDATGTRRDDGRLCVRFAVNDTGIGIPEDRRDRLFRTFSQVDSSTTREFGGSGLGLSICKQLVELMDGTIGINSQLGIGSTFWFEVPLQVLHEVPAVTANDRGLAGSRVLVVADAGCDITTITDSLKAWECETELATTYRDAITTVMNAEALNAPWDIVLAELPVDATTRRELVETLSRSHRLPVIAFGRASSDGEARLLCELGLRRLLRDPVRPSALHDALVFARFSGTSNTPREVPADVAPPSEPQLLRGHVLVAEDNRINQMYVTELLKHVGCTFELASNGDEALVAIQNQRFDLVLMDCQMPEMDGFTASREIRRREPTHELAVHIPIVALTANALKEDRDRCLDAGMDDYLTKPLNAGRLREMLTRFLPTQAGDNDITAGGSFKT